MKLLKPIANFFVAVLFALPCISFASNESSPEFKLTASPKIKFQHATTTALAPGEEAQLTLVTKKPGNIPVQGACNAIVVIIILLNYNGTTSTSDQSTESWVSYSQPIISIAESTKVAQVELKPGDVVKQKFVNESHSRHTLGLEIGFLPEQRHCFEDGALQLFDHEGNTKSVKPLKSLKEII